MVNPAQLVQALSLATGMPLASVVDMDRRLVTAGLRSKTGRGRNAARMTPQDAAHLLTAILASPQANQAAEAVLRYTGTQVDRSRSSDRLFAAGEIADLGKLKASHSFVEGLTGLILSAATGSLVGVIERGRPSRLPRLEVLALTRATHGRIRISGLPTGLTASLEYGPPARAGSRAVIQPERSQTGDLEQSRRVTERTIFAVAALFSEQEDPS